MESSAVELLEILQAQATRALDEVARSLPSPGARVRPFVRVGNAADVILDVANEERVSLIAMTSHGRTGLSRWMLGSVAEKVLRASRVPVLVVRASKGGGAKPLSLDKILVPTDGSAESMAVVTPVLDLAHALGAFGARMVVLHVEIPLFIPGGEMGALPSPPPTPSLEDPLTVPMANRFREAGLGVERLTVQGDAAGQILDQAHAAGAGLVAMATHGRSGFSRWLLGSVAERVLRHADLPLLLIRAEKVEAKGKARREKAAVSSP